MLWTDADLAKLERLKGTELKHKPDRLWFYEKFTQLKKENEDMQPLLEQMVQCITDLDNTGKSAKFYSDLLKEVGGK